MEEVLNGHDGQIQQLLQHHRSGLHMKKPPKKNLRVMMTLREDFLQNHDLLIQLQHHEEVFIFADIGKDLIGVFGLKTIIQQDGEFGDERTAVIVLIFNMFFNHFDSFGANE